MSRIRTVKPELFKHEDLFDAELSSGLPLRLAFIGLFTVADREGRFRWKPRTLKLDVLPHDTIDFAAVLNALEQAGFIRRYEVNGEAFGWIPTFTKHQRFSGKEAELKSELPPPPEGSNREAMGKQWGSNGEAMGNFPTASQGSNGEATGKQTGTQEGKGKEGKGKGREEEAAPAPRASTPRAPIAPVIETPATEPPAPQATQAPKASKPVKPVKRRIPPDWTPAETTYALLEKHGIPRPFAEACIDEFRLYWQERGESRAGWEATFVNNARHQWEHRPTPAPTNPRHGPSAKASDPRITEVETILAGIRRPVLEGEFHVA